MQLAELVDDLFAKASELDPAGNVVTIDGIFRPWHFNVEVLHQIYWDVLVSIYSLPVRGKGHVLRFVDCFRNLNDERWTENPAHIERLMLLAAACGIVEGMPRHLWKSQPYEMPAFRILKDFLHTSPPPTPEKETEEMATPRTPQLETDAKAKDAAAKAVSNDKEIEAQLQRLTTERAGNKLVVPEGMSWDVAIRALEKKKNEESVVVNCVADFDLTLPEGALTLFRTLDELYGFVELMKTPGFLRENPPSMITVQISPTERVQFPWGRLSVPGIEGYLETGYETRQGFPYFQLRATIKSGSRQEFDRLANAIRNRKENLYGGKAIRVAFPDLSEDAVGIVDFFPVFLELPHITREQLIFAEDIEDIVEVALFTPIERTAFCREHGIPLKRGILLEGPYGVGKTLAANVAARLCAENGWTFIQVNRVQDVARAYQFALRHQPAIVFCEDIDEVMNEESGRSEEINAILNSVDGIESKSAEIITVLTTNDLENITKAMLRPGRIDTVIPVRPPDSAAAQRLIRLYAGVALPAAENLSVAGSLLAGHNAAVVREVVNRSKLSAVRRITESGQMLSLIAHDIELAARQMQAHSELLEDEEESEFESPQESAADILGKHIAGALTTWVPKSLPVNEFATNGSRPRTAATPAE